MTHGVDPARIICGNGSDDLLHLLAHVAGKSAIRVAVVHPCDALSLSAALEARTEGLIEPILVAPAEIAVEVNFYVDVCEDRVFNFIKYMRWTIF